MADFKGLTEINGEETMDEQSKQRNKTAIRVNDSKSARRLLSRLIYFLQKKQISGQEAKDLTYLLSTFITIQKSFEFEERLTELEKQYEVKK